MAASALWRRYQSCSIAIASLLLGAAASAQEIEDAPSIEPVAALESARAVEIDYRACEDVLAVRADDQNLSRVISDLAQELGFELRFNVESERTITVDAEGPAVEVLRQVTQGANVIIAEAENEECPGQTRVVQVRFLGAGPKLTEAELAARYPVSRNADEQFDWDWGVSQSGDAGNKAADTAELLRDLFGQPQNSAAAKADAIEQIFGGNAQAGGGAGSQSVENSRALDELFNGPPRNPPGGAGGSGTRPGTAVGGASPFEQLFGVPPEAPQPGGTSPDQLFGSPPGAAPGGQDSAQDLLGGGKEKDPGKGP